MKRVPMDRADQAVPSTANAKARSGMYRLLSILFRREPTAELIKQFRGAQFRDALLSAGVTLADDFLCQPDTQCLADLEVEYARLFIGPGGHISPHESVHRQGEESGLYGQATVNVRQFLETAGFVFQPNYHGLPDHISVELEFMQTLTTWEAEAWDKCDIKLVIKCLDVETAFLRQHLICWIPNFCTKVIEEAVLSFYREIARLTKDFIGMEQAYLSTAKQRISINKI